MVQGSSQRLEKLTFALMGYRMTIRTSVGATPYVLVYGTEVVIHIYIEIPSLRTIIEEEMEDTEWDKSRCKLHVFRSDNVTEYTLDPFKNICEVAGIEHQLTTPYIPHQNGVSERKSRTIMDMSRCMLHEKELPKKFWEEAANTTVFFLNRLPTKVVSGRNYVEQTKGYVADG
ncbi:uncharacterized protein LOC107030096 [Solanum pennellii]|uniref:Uncharacterized protein LOC107030096 n=1 Tax=Solanum pennellii TaxID=28526 RepID=A0ABM1HKX7_SOLPN|nr:uncharacterized protein LOC107030096 [Solanum pennellii]